MDGGLNINAVAQLVGVTPLTINHWYKFKKENPEHELAKMLPDYSQAYATAPRLWSYGAIRELIKFKETRPLGCGGQMGSVTKRYYKKKGN